MTTTHQLKLIFSRLVILVDTVAFKFSAEKHCVKHIKTTRKEIIGSESVYLDDITASELEERLCRAEPLEIGMTLVYRGGFCDLNKPTDSTALSVHKAVGVLLSIKVSHSEVPNFYFISFDENDWKNIATPK
ncbi:uncharacterized protein LOC126456408 [Schistocerca serialis cubense]|uniref:uncharacterized protein LOC126456408 n=1 Tax=Schistocerca serialis cubense TaxID=2023355 RepID=UPI00214F4FC5|nr:uncharacterized protein LOC126456408 [Schistocerca serialis cubense]